MKATHNSKPCCSFARVKQWQSYSIKVACRVQIWKKNCQDSDKFGYSFIKNNIVFNSP